MIAIKSVAAMQVPVLVYKDGTTFELTPGAMVNDPARVRGAISRYVSEEHKMFDDALKSVCFVKAFLQEQLDESTELLRDLVVHTELDELEDITRRAGEFLLKKDDENERDNDNDERERRTADADTGN